MTTGKRSTKKRAISSTEAYASLQSRRRRLERRKTGPPSLVFGPREIESVRVLAWKGKSQESIAHLSGLTTKKFRDAMEKDEALREAWLLGKAERREARIANWRSRAWAATCAPQSCSYGTSIATPARP